MDVLFCGGIFTDLCAYCPVFPKDGETLFGTKFEMGFGGKASNASVMCAKLGARVGIMGRIGDDGNGRAYIENYKANNVDISNLRIDANNPSGVASIWINSTTGENKIIIVPGANSAFCPQDVDPEAFKGVKAVAFALEAAEDGTLAALKIAKSTPGVRTVVNAAPASKNINPEILSNTDILCVNEGEAELITGSGSLEKAIEILLKNCSTVIITLGSKGAMFVTNEDSEPVYVKCPKVEKVLDTTGAGDAFVGAFMYCMFVKGYGLTLSVEKACFVASDTVQRLGTQSSYRPLSI